LAKREPPEAARPNPLGRSGIKRKILHPFKSGTRTADEPLAFFLGDGLKVLRVFQRLVAVELIEFAAAALHAARLYAASVG
jgi:hypothetical protein